MISFVADNDRRRQAMQWREDLKMRIDEMICVCVCVCVRSSEINCCAIKEL